MRNKLVTLQKREPLTQEEKEERKLRKWVKAGLIENGVLFDKTDFEGEFDKVMEELDEYKEDYPDEEIDSSVINGLVFSLLDQGYFELDEDEE